MPATPLTPDPGTPPTAAGAGIDNLTEIFGAERGRGFADLSLLDTNRDGAITAADRDFAKLTIWQDKDHRRTRAARKCPSFVRMAA